MKHVYLIIRQICNSADCWENAICVAETEEKAKEIVNQFLQDAINHDHIDYWYEKFPVIPA